MKRRRFLPVAIISILSFLPGGGWSYCRAWNPQCFQFLLVVCARLGTVIRDEDNLLSCTASGKSECVFRGCIVSNAHTIVPQQFERLDRSGEKVVSGPEDAY